MPAIICRNRDDPEGQGRSGDAMAEAFIYDHVRTPRGRGKSDGSLHEVTALRLAETALRAIKDRNGLDTRLVDDVVLGCVDPVGEAGRRHRPCRRPRRRLRRPCAGRADQPLLRLRSRRRELCRRAGDGRPARHGDRRRRRIDEPHRHRRLRRRLARRPRHRREILLHAAGRLGGPHRHEIRLLA